MKISAKAEYACLAMLELAANSRDRGPLAVKVIADVQGITQHFLVQILLQLKNAGLVNSIRGSSGGYQLAVPPERVSLAQIIRAVDDRSLTVPGEPEGETTPFKEALRAVWREVHTAEQRMLESVSLADLINKTQAKDVLSYQI